MLDDLHSDLQYDNMTIQCRKVDYRGAAAPKKKAYLCLRESGG